MAGITGEQVESPFSEAHLPWRAVPGQVIAGFIVDFYCHKSALVVEVDGDVHDLQQEEDTKREKALSELGLRIVRFKNDEVSKDLSAVVGKIKAMVSE